MGFTRSFKRAQEEKKKAPRCCGQHMFMNKAGLWQCKKCGRQKFDIGPAKKEDTPVIANESVETEVAGTVESVPAEVIDVEAKTVEQGE